jgi:uncharacterized membrane protein
MSPSPTPPLRLRRGFLYRARRRILAGLVIVVPLVVTFFVASLAYQFLQRLVGPLLDPAWDRLLGQIFIQRSLIRTVVEAVVTLGVGLGLLYLCGLISTTFLTRWIFGMGEAVLLRIPLLKNIYSLTKQAIDLVMSKEKNAFKELVLIEYPRQGVYALAFVTGETRLSDGPGLHVNLFLPTTPNPTSGFMLILPEAQVRVIEMSIEEGVRLIMSGGVISPQELQLRPYHSPASGSPDASLPGFAPPD